MLNNVPLQFLDFVSVYIEKRKEERFTPSESDIFIKKKKKERGAISNKIINHFKRKILLCYAKKFNQITHILMA